MDSLRISLLTSNDPSCPTITNDSVVRYLINRKRQAHRVFERRVDPGNIGGGGNGVNDSTISTFESSANTMLALIDKQRRCDVDNIDTTVDEEADGTTDGFVDESAYRHKKIDVREINSSGGGSAMAAIEANNDLWTALVPSLGCVVYRRTRDQASVDAANDNSIVIATDTNAIASKKRKREDAKSPRDQADRAKRPNAAKMLGRRTNAFTAATVQPSSEYVIPPYEYCSVAMLNHLRLGHRADRVLTDKGGTIKNILQSNKSFIHYLITYPLKNTFRGYIQVSPYLAPRHIALPYHHATRLFSIDVERDAESLRYRPTGATCRSARCYNRRFAVSPLVARNATTARLTTATTATTVTTLATFECECDVWPDDNCQFYFDATRNFSLVLKRDPCIHNGSIVGIKRVYVYNSGVEHNDSIHISPFILKHLNADFDGDAVTIMIIRGIESSCELEECMNDPVLFGAIPRYTFCQSMIFWIFRMLAFDDERDERRAVLRHCDETGALAPQAASELLHVRTNLWRSRKARRRARRVFGDWYENYKNVLSAVWRMGDGDDQQSSSTLDWSVPVWRQQAVLDRVYVNAVYERRIRSSRRGRKQRDPQEIFEFMHRRILDYRTMNRERDGLADGRYDFHRLDDTIVLLDREIFCLENWLIVHSGAKATPQDLQTLHERYHERDRTTRPRTSESSNSTIEPPYVDFFRECRDEREQEYLRYLDDFVVISKHVPRSSYFASGLKWVTQMCSVSKGDLYMRDALLLRDLAYYFKSTDCR